MNEPEPTRYERYLMTLLHFETLAELIAFLNGPSHPAFLEQSVVPEYDDDPDDLP